MKTSSLLLLAFASTVALAADAPVRPWNEDIIYFALTDRFFDGDPSNNIPVGSDPALYDEKQSEIGKYHGGDLRGLEKAIEAGYFETLGVTAIWISPPVRNVWNTTWDAKNPSTGYHGYAAQDFLDIDPHLVSRRSLDGKKEYPDTRDGRMQHYKDFVALAHARGLKVIQDIVCNHAGPVFYYDANENGAFDREKDNEWQLPFRVEGFYPFAKWMNVPEWNALPTMPGGPVTLLGRELKTTGILQKLDTYGRKGSNGDSLGKTDGEEVICDFFSLRDFWTAPGSAHFDRLVDEFVEIHRFYLEEIGVDGFRVDTVKHVHREFWEAFCTRLRQRIGPERARRLLIFGEVYEGTPITAGKYTYSLRYPVEKAPVMDSVLNFQFCFAVRDYLRHTRNRWGSPASLEFAMKSLESPNYNGNPGADGLNSRQKMVNFVENHDDINRFRAAGVDFRANLLANALLAVSPGIPCVYYGTEAALEDPRGSTLRPGQSGRMTYIPQGKEERIKSLMTSPEVREFAALGKLRREWPALTRGEWAPLWVDNGGTRTDDGIFAFARFLRDKDGAVVPGTVLIIVCNASMQKSVTGQPGNPMRLVDKAGKPLLPAGTPLKIVATIPMKPDMEPSVKTAAAEGVITAEITTPPQGMIIAGATPK